MLSAFEKDKKIKNQLKSPSTSALAKLKSAINKEIKNRNKKGLLPEEAVSKGYEAHHIVPKEMEIQFGKVFDELGINLDDAFNGTMLPPVREFDEVVENAKNTLKYSEIPANFWNRAKHQTHPDYNNMIKEDLNDLFKGFENLSKSDKELVKRRFYKMIKDRKKWLQTLTDENTLKVLG